LKLDDGFRFLELKPKPFVLPLESGIFLGKWILLGFFPPTLLGGHRVQDALVPLPPPGGQVGRIESLSSKQGAQLTGLNTGIRFLKDIKLVLCCEPSSRVLLGDLWIRSLRGLLSCKNQIHCSFFHDLPTYPPYTNFSRGRCLTHIGTEGVRIDRKVSLISPLS
jgi:hypothetical protein